MTGQQNLRWRLRLEWLAILLLACGLGIAADRTSALDRIDLALLDRAMPFAAAPASDSIMLVEFDERSLAALGKWPWPRAEQARLIKALAEARAQTIVYDVLMVDPGSPEDDAAFAAAIAAAGNVALPLTFQAPGADGRSIDVLRPVAAIEKAVAATGHVALYPDDDGIVRSVDLQGAPGGPPFPHLVEEALALHSQLGPAKRAPARGRQIVPLLPRGSFRSVSAASLLAGEVPRAFFAGKTVFVGATAQAMGDSFPVSGRVGAQMPGIEIQANLANGLIANRLVSPGPASLRVWLAGLTTLLLMIGLWRAPPRVSLWLALGMLAMLTIGSFVLLVQGLTWIPVGGSLLAVVVAYPLWNWRRLNALDAFVEGEARRIGVADEYAGGDAGLGLDRVSRKAERLRAVIGELSARESFIKGIVEASPDAMCVLDAQDNVVFSNVRAIELFGESPVGEPLNELVMLVAVPGTISQDEWLSRDGRSILVTRAAIHNRLDQTGTMIVRFADITALREVEREQREMLEFLSHDMRTPQAAIISLAARAAKGEHDPVFLEQVRRNAERTLKMSDDFVQLARLRSIEPEIEEIDLCDLLLEAIDQAYPLASEKGVRIVGPVAGETAFIAADGAILLRALANLIGNAVKYAPQDSVIECQVTVAHEAVTGEGRATCTILDHGPGIEPARLENLFARFGQADRSQPMSAGLGLAFVHLAVERNRGTIECASGSAGTCFTLKFPMID